MRVLFVPKEGVQLYQELLSSETSRDALRFYQPVQTSAGVQISMASMGSALSLASDLRWYVRRYMRDVLFELSEGVYCTRALAEEIYYGRSAVLHTPWKFRRACSFRGGHVLGEDPVKEGVLGVTSASSSGGEDTVVLEVWCTREEFLGQKKNDEKNGEGEEGLTSS